MSGNTYITRACRLNNALQFTESFTEPSSNIYFMFAGRHLPYSNESSPPRSNESVQGLVIDIYDNMLYAKHLQAADVSVMTRRINWVSGTVYSPYNHNVADLFSTNFYVSYKDGATYKIYKCIDNNGGVPSTVPPTQVNAADEHYVTSDGYEWKWMYSVSEVDWDKFTTTNYMPVIPNAAVTGNAVSGAIDNIRVYSPGARYNSFHDGVIQSVTTQGTAQYLRIESDASSNNDFYLGSVIQIMSGAASGQVREIVDYTVNGTVKTVQANNPFNPIPAPSDLYEISPRVLINGDGSGAAARAIVSGLGTIQRIEVINRGSGYTWANCQIIGNTGIVGTSFVSANVTPIISPPGGHGADVYKELGATAVALATTFDSTLSSNTIIDTNDVRTFGLIQDPLFSEVSMTLNSVIGSFSIGEVVTQSNTINSGIVTSTTGGITLTNVRGYFQSGLPIIGATSGATAITNVITSPSTYVNTTLELIVDELAAPFTLDEVVTQGSNALGYVHSCTLVTGATYKVKLTNVRGTWNVTDDATDLSQTIYGTLSTLRGGVVEVDQSSFVRGSGTVLFTDNVLPITKTPGQKETVKLILEF